MYELYHEKQSKKNKPFVKSTYYRFIFCTEFNLSFHRPKKDLCKTCEKFKNKECSDVNYNNISSKKNSQGRRKTKIERRQLEKVVIELQLLTFRVFYTHHVSKFLHYFILENSAYITLLFMRKLPKMECVISGRNTMAREEPVKLPLVCVYIF